MPTARLQLDLTSLRGVSSRMLLTPSGVAVLRRHWRVVPPRLSFRLRLRTGRRTRWRFRSPPARRSSI